MVKASQGGRVDDSAGPPRAIPQPARRSTVRSSTSPNGLAHVSVLDAACGSGNFLYVAIHMLLDLEKEVIAYAATRGLSLVPQVNPAQLHGLEINPYAQELAQVVIWIGYLQWMHYNGFKMPDHPVLTPIDTIKQMDAILDLSDPEHPKEPEWPEAEFIVGNPPFLGGEAAAQELGRRLRGAMFKVCDDGRLPGGRPLLLLVREGAAADRDEGNAGAPGCWRRKEFAAARIARSLKRIKESGDIFFAESDREWILDGATVHISMVGFDGGSRTEPCPRWQVRSSHQR